MRINFASCDWANGVFEDNGMPVMGGSGHARVLLPSRFLRRHGHTTMEGHLVVQMSMGGRKVLSMLDHANRPHLECDVLVLQRYMDIQVLQAIDDYRAQGGKIVNDIDDHFWKLDPRNNAHAATDPRLHPTNNRDLYKEVLRKSDLITVSTPYLYSEMKKMCPGTEIVVLENAVDLERYPTKMFDDAGEHPTFGWVGAQAWRSGDLESVAFLGKVFQRYGCGFHHSGVMKPDELTQEMIEIYDRDGVKALPPEYRSLELKRCWFRSAGEILEMPEATASEMTRISEYPTMFEPIDVGLVPLNPVEFNRAKSNLKGLEYTAAGVPWIASPWAEYVRAHEKYGLGLLPDGFHKSYGKHAKIWEAKVKLMLDPEFRQEEREKNLAIVKEHFDFATRWKDWEAIYAAVAKGEKVG